MRVLLIAYEFPPVIAAQSLRWYYLANELAKLGVEVHVVCPAFRGLDAFEGDFHRGVHLHRIWPGPFIGLSQWLRGEIQQDGVMAQKEAATQGWSAFAWRLYRIVRQVLNHVLFPDLRTEWFPFAFYKALALSRSYRFDCIIASHEPGVDIFIGLALQKMTRMPLVIDLADPLLAPYTPRWRAYLDRAVEKYICQKADKIVVTTESVIDLLNERHGILSLDRFAVVPQGFPVRSGTVRDQVQIQVGPMVLAYTGTFYREFRNPIALVGAMMKFGEDKVRLVVAGDNVDFTGVFSQMANVITYLGRVDHFQSLRIQDQADILVNIGNVHGFQIPGKVYEYLGAGKPILHIQTGDQDSGADLISRLQAGIVVKNTEANILNALQNLYSQWCRGVLVSNYNICREELVEYSWNSRAQGYLEVLRGVVKSSR